MNKTEQKQEEVSSSVVYLGRIPHGFYEEEMRSYFSQFGEVVKLRLSRNKKTGASKHYAFIEFVSPSVARIVADTMNNYLLFGSLLQCSVLPRDKIHPDLWIGANSKFKPLPTKKLARLQHNSDSSSTSATTIKKLAKKDEIRRIKLKDAGIAYDFIGYASKKVAVENKAK